MSNKKKKLEEKSKTSYELWRIDWADHASSTGPWTPIEDVDPTVLVIHSVGFKIFEDKDVIVLAGNVSENDGGKVADYITILKSCIVSKRKLI